MIPVIAAWCGHTPASREMAQNLERAYLKYQHKQEAIADRLGLAREDLGKQLAGVKPLNAWRLGYLSSEVYLEWLRLEAKRHGAEMITAEERAFVVGFARAGIKRMAKCLPQFFDDRQVG